MAEDIRGEMAAGRPARAATGMASLLDELKFRDPEEARALTGASGARSRRPGAPSPSCTCAAATEQAIARFGLRAAFPATSTSSWGRAAQCA